MEYLSINSKKTKNINLGIQLLRMLMSFWVVLNHCYKTKNRIFINIIFKHKFHIPCFIIISFYFLNANLSNRKIEKIYYRLERLLIPYIIYPIIYWIFNNLLCNLFNFNKLNFVQLLTQLLIGRPFYGVIWFQFNLILLTIAFYIISLIFKRNYLFILQILGIFAYIIQYSKLNYVFFNQYNDKIKFSVGYLSETIPLAITGLTISSFDLINKIKKIRIKCFIFSLLFIFMLFKYDIFISINGFGKQGLMHNFGGLTFFILFSLFPFNNYNNIIIKKIIINFTNFTAGIYFLHVVVYKILKHFINIVKDRTIFGCIIIYLISYLICFIFYKKLKKTKLIYLFN